MVIRNESDKWHLFKNEMSKVKNNKYITVEVGNSSDGNTSALGVIVTMKLCDGSNLVQCVGTTGAQYSLNHNSLVHFGLGSCVKPVKVEVE